MCKVVRSTPTDSHTYLVAGDEDFDGGGSGGAASVAHHHSSAAAAAAQTAGAPGAAGVQARRRLLVDDLQQQSLGFGHGIRRASQRALSLGTRADLVDLIYE